MVKKIPQSKKAITGELRQDLITGKWAVIATGRSRKPNDFSGEKNKAKTLPRYKDDCPFCNLATFPQEPDVLRLPNDPDHWQVHIFGNKYPAFRPAEEFRTWNKGPYRAMEAVGYHEILATRWHNQTETNMSVEELALELEAVVLRYRQLRSKPSVNYIQIIRNYGEEAGASLEHPHHQIFTLPVLPDDVRDLLFGAEKYATTNNSEVFNVILDFERDAGERIVWENEHFTVYCPYASRAPFETWIMPRQPQPFFEDVDPDQRQALAEAMSQALRRLKAARNDPSFNYFIHSAPCDDTGFVCDKSLFQHFRWHIEIMPRSGHWGGLEFATGLEINHTMPEDAARELREVELKS